jgi:predicted membrane GTPase involved in stress response
MKHDRRRAHRENDLVVNINKMKQQTNVRSATKDQTVSMKKPRIMSLEESLEYLNEDEYCEVTPESIRLRKKILDKKRTRKSSEKEKAGRIVVTFAEPKKRATQLSKGEGNLFD